MNKTKCLQNLTDITAGNHNILRKLPQYTQKYIRPFFMMSESRSVLLAQYKTSCSSGIIYLIAYLIFSILNCEYKS